MSRFRYGKFESVGELLDKYLKPTDKILQIGCGTSRLADELYDVGYRKIQSIDIVSSVIEQQKAKNVAARPELSFEVMDVKKVSINS